MTKEDILKGESKNIEYKILLPEKSDKYLKSVDAFANTSGGKIIIGIDDKEKKLDADDEKKKLSELMRSLYFRLWIK